VGNLSAGYLSKSPQDGAFREWSSKKSTKVSWPAKVSAIVGYIETQGLFFVAKLLAPQAH
jgi:hypothetical protein